MVNELQDFLIRRGTKIVSDVLRVAITSQIKPSIKVSEGEESQTTTTEHIELRQAPEGRIPPITEVSSEVAGSQQTQKQSTVTPEETLRYQNTKISEVIYGLELHLAEGCRIAGKPCDCCEKHSLARGLAIETIPIASRMGRPTEPYDNLIAWIEKNKSKFSVQEVALGKHQKEYKPLAGELSLLRKAITSNSPELAHSETITVANKVQRPVQLTPEDKEKIKQKAHALIDEKMEKA